MVQLVMIVLLATMIDMLLPNSEMRRYTRFVLSLMITLALIDPVFKFFSLEPLQGDLLKAISFAPSEHGFDQKGMTDLQMIEKNGTRIRQRLEDQAFDITRHNMESALADKILEVTGEQNRVALVFKNQELERIEVYLLGQVHKKSNKDALFSSTLTIQPIEVQPVDVAVSKIGVDDERQGEDALPQPAFNAISDQAVDAELKAQIQALVQNTFALNGVPIHVYRP